MSGRAYAAAPITIMGRLTADLRGPSLSGYSATINKNIIINFINNINAVQYIIPFIRFTQLHS
jgi:hypothetical protein